MTLSERLSTQYPHTFFAEVSAPQALTDYLRRQGWISPSQRVLSLERAGEGNMNLVLRVGLDDGGTFIVKQSRPWAAKYPSVAAPLERAEVEAEFYRRTARVAALAARSPRLLQADADAHLLLLEDLGPSRDLTTLYAANSVLEPQVLEALVEYLVVLHREFRQPTCGFRLQNRAMRALNAEHIFQYPFAAGTAFDRDTITPGLTALAASCREDAPLQEVIQMLAARYLADGDTLLHGDYFPGSVLLTPDGIRVIDPEFCFFGDAEFDVGVLLAHLTLAGQPASRVEQALSLYVAGVAGVASVDAVRCWQYAGIEVLRRLLGLAQLPLPLAFDAKRALVQQARGWLLLKD